MRRGEAYPACPVPGCVRHEGHRGQCKVRVDGRVRPLTPHQQDMLVGLVEHGGSRSAAPHLGIAESTLAQHLTTIRHRLGAKTTTHAVVLTYPAMKARYDAALPR